MIITKDNLYRRDLKSMTKICHFCQVQKHEKHFNCYHGFRDFMGIKSLDLEYMTDTEALERMKKEEKK
tara:strand:- start:180 stop:383 length:204 start_codon:yes stop_codon:yes gene_type:complete